MEAEILAHLQADTTITAAFARLSLADSITALEQPSYPAAEIFDTGTGAESAPSKRGERQVVTHQVAVKIISERTVAAAKRKLIRDSLIGWQPSGAIGPLRYERGQLQQLSADAVIWLDVFAVDALEIREP